MKKSKTFINYTVDVWMRRKTILNEIVIIEEGTEEIIDVIRREYGPGASYNIVKQNSILTF